MNNLNKNVLGCENVIIFCQYNSMEVAFDSLDTIISSIKEKFILIILIIY